MTSQRLQAGSFVPMTCKEILNSFDMTPMEGIGRSLAWYRHCQIKHGLFEYPTVEFVRGLAGYLTSRIVELDITARAPRILEVAAGRGLLSALVSQALQQQDVLHRITAVDDDSWNLTRRKRWDVDKLDFRDALPIYKPDIIIGAWLPGTDKQGHSQRWSRHFRQSPYTQEYLLIGPPDGHANSEDWGKEMDPTIMKEVASSVPAYELEGFERVDLTHLQPVQFCLDSTSNNLHPSLTVSYRRTVSNPIA